MKQNYLRRFLMGVALLSGSVLLMAQTATEKFQAAGVKSGVIRVKLAEEHPVIKKVELFKAQEASADANLKASQSIQIEGLPQFNDLNEKHQASKMTRVFRHAGKHELKHRAFGLHLWYDIEYQAGTKIEDVIADYRRLDYLSEVYPHYLYEKKGSLVNGSNDPRLGEQWHYENNGGGGGTVDADIDLVAAWTVETGNANVVVAIEDGGVDVNHPDLAGNIWVNPGEIANNNIDDDNNGYIDDVNGFNFVNNTGSVSADNHGTHVAGTVGAETNNGIGVAGVAGGSGSNDGVRLMSCQVFTSTSSGGFAEAMTYAADNGAVISQNSWGYRTVGVYDPAVLTAIDYFVANAGGPGEAMQGGVVIVAAGNDGQDGQWYPGYYASTIAVSSVNNQDKKAYYSNFGTWVDIAAPGGETTTGSSNGVLSTLPNSSYGFYQGTSMACPHVSGVAALVVSKNYGSITASQLRQILETNVDPIDNLNPSYVGKLGSGRLNAYKALGGGSSNVPPSVSLTSPNNGASFEQGTSINIVANASDSDGSVSKVEFYAGTTYLGVDYSAPYNYAWNNAAVGSYSITAVATDNQNASTTSSAVSIQVTPQSGNVPPTVSITSPNNGDSFVEGTTVTITASASDSDGSVSSVEFFRGSTSLGSDASAPYSVNVSNLAVGDYVLTAVATDNQGASTTSALVNISITPGSGGCTAPQYVAGTSYPTGYEVQNVGKKYECKVGGWCSSSAAWAYAPGEGLYWQDAWTDRGICSGGNTPPSVSISSPNNGASFVEGTAISISASATDSDGSVSQVEFFAGSTSLGTDFNAPYSISWNNAAVGTYSITAVATDNENASTTSSAISIEVTPQAGNIPPSVSITAPNNGDSFVEGTSITVSANASDSDGTVTQVEFFAGSTTLGTDMSAPYLVNWENNTAGTYSITAVATDNQGATTTSSIVSIEIVPQTGNVPPSVSITAPNNGDSFVVGSAVTVSANASDSDGSVTQVQFFAGSTSLGTDNSSPYSISTSSLSLGSHSLTAVATDNQGATTTSAAVSITITPGSGGCTAPQYVAGTPYATNEEVQNNGNLYRCKVGGWCSNAAAWAYEPGEGLYWTSAWEDKGICTTQAAIAARAANRSIGQEVELFPNPFNDELMLSVSLERSTLVEFRLYNMQGAEVLVVSEKAMPEGNHILEVETASLPAGMYVGQLFLDRKPMKTMKLNKK